MLHDLFICHASEDKDDFVRALAEALRLEHVDVWYDEFSLRMGDSLRRCIDRGLRESQYGIVVLSRAFIAKKWTQYELDGLVEREVSEGHTVILPVWHGVSHDDVIAFSPSMANKKATLSEKGISHVVADILEVIRPSGSPLLAARETLKEWGITPPIVTDQYWLDVVEASNRLNAFGAVIPEECHWGRWSFPLPPKEPDAQAWGERLACTAMQLRWTAAAEARAITPLTEPAEVLAFIREYPGLLETCLTFPSLAAEYAPQLTIPGMGGPLEEAFEKAYQKSLAKEATSTSGTGLTTDGRPPRCDEDWALRHPYFAYYSPSHVACEYFTGGMFGPPVSPYTHVEHVAWLLSSRSAWMPSSVRDFLRQGMSHWDIWVWHEFAMSPEETEWPSRGAYRALLDAARSPDDFRWTEDAMADVRSGMEECIRKLCLPETAQELVDEMSRIGMPQMIIAHGLDREARRAASGNGSRNAPASTNANGAGID